MLRSWTESVRLPRAGCDNGCGIGDQPILSSVHSETSRLVRSVLTDRSTCWLRATALLVCLFQTLGERIGCAGDDPRAGGSEIVSLDGSKVPPFARLTGHQDIVTSVAFSPGGDKLASASCDKSVRYWNVAMPPYALDSRNEHEERVWSVAFSSDGKTLASGGYDGKVRLWTAKPERLVAQSFIAADEICVWSVRFAPNSGLLVSGAMDNRVRLWDVTTRPPREKAVVLGHVGEEPVLAIPVEIDAAMSPDGRTLVASNNYDQIAVWDMVDRKPKLRTRTFNGGHVIFTPDGRKLLVNGGYSVNVRDVDDPKIRTLTKFASRHDYRPSSQFERYLCAMALSPDGKTAAVSDIDNRVIFWRVDTGKTVSEWRLGKRVTAMDFSRDGRHLALGVTDGKIYVVGSRSCLLNPGER